MPKLTRKQTGSKSSRNFTGRLARKVGSRVRTPWGGPNIPLRTRIAKVTGGSATRKSRSDPSLAPQTRGYPRNSPGDWPVEPDYDNHTLSPSSSAPTQTMVDKHNAAVENAYKRAGYQ